MSGLSTPPWHKSGGACEPRAALQVTVSGFAGPVSGLFAKSFGYQAVFAAGGVMTLCALPPVMMFFRPDELRS